MRRVLQHVSRSVLQETGLSTRPTAGLRLKIPTTSSSSSVCIQCRFRTSLAQEARIFPITKPIIPYFQYRYLSSDGGLRKDERPEIAKNNPAAAEIPTPPPPFAESSSDVKPSLNGSAVHIVPDEDLPSYQEKLRWGLSKRFNRIMDGLMPRLALASQRINTYTGTDYSGIEALRKEIIEHGMQCASLVFLIERG
jgi:sensitive to high expression protein 9